MHVCLCAPACMRASFLLIGRRDGRACRMSTRCAPCIQRFSTPVAAASTSLALPSQYYCNHLSRYSEALSIDLLAEKLGAQSVQLEMEVPYWFQGKMFDYVAMKHDGTSVAVSVTRVLDNAMNGFSVDKARTLLKKKTENMLMAARCMSKVRPLLMLTSYECA